MDFKSRHRIFKFLIVTITIPLNDCSLSDYGGSQIRAHKLKEYGDRLSSIEDDVQYSQELNPEDIQRADAGTYLKGRNAPITDNETPKDIDKENAKRGINKEFTLNNPKTAHESEEINPVDNDVADDDESDIKQVDSKDDKEENTMEVSTKCTTDKLIEVGNYQPESSVEKGKAALTDEDVDGAQGGQTDEDEADGEQTNEGDEVLHEEISKEDETATKVYSPPKKASLPDHYVDDV